jgi:PUB domain
VDNDRKEEVMERGLEALSLLNDQAQSQVRSTIELLFKILSNVKASPMD